MLWWRRGSNKQHLVGFLLIIRLFQKINVLAFNLSINFISFISDKHNVGELIALKYIFFWWPKANICLFKSFWGGRNTFIIKHMICLVLKAVFDSYFIAKLWRSVCTYAYSVAIGTKGHKLSLLWLCYPNQYWWYRIDARTSMKTRFSSMKRLDYSVNYNLSQSKSIFVISDLQKDWFLVYLVFWCEFPHTVPISNKQTNIKGMVFQILTYKSVTNRDIGKLQRLINTSSSNTLRFLFTISKRSENMFTLYVCWFWQVYFNE